MRLIKDNVERIAASEAQIRKLEAAGYVPVGSARSEKKEEVKPELEKLKADELKALAKEKGIEGAASLTKDELLAVLKDVS